MSKSEREMCVSAREGKRARERYVSAREGKRAREICEMSG